MNTNEKEGKEQLKELLEFKQKEEAEKNKQKELDYKQTLYSAWFMFVGPGALAMFLKSIMFYNTYEKRDDVWITLKKQFTFFNPLNWVFFWGWIILSLFGLFGISYFSREKTRKKFLEMKTV
jgi:hypothetical protein